MSSVTQLENLVVRLTGDASDYNQILDQAETSIQNTVQVIEQRAREAMAAQNAMLQEAARITEAVRTPTEKYESTINDLNHLLGAGAISQETYNRAVKQATSAISGEAQAAQELAQRQEAGKRVMESVMTPMERHKRLQADVAQLYRMGAIDVGTYNRAIAQSAAQLPRHQAMLQAEADALQRANAVYMAARTPMETYQAKLGEINVLLRDGMISNETYARTLKQINAEYGGLVGGLGAAGAAMQSTGRTMSMYITAPIVAFGLASGKAFGGFQQEMANMNAAAKPTEEELTKLRDRAMELSKELQIDPTKILSGFTELLKAGVDVDKVLQSDGKSMIQFARVGELETAVAATIMADSMTVFGESAESTGNLLSAAADASSISIKQIADAFTQVSAISGAARQSLEDTSAAIAVLGKNGVKGSDAGTSLKTMLLSLMAPVDRAASALKKYNIQTRDSEGHMLPMVKIIEQLQQQLGGLNEAVRDDALKDIFGSDAIRAAQIFMKTGVDGFNEMKVAMSGSNTIAEKYAITMDTLFGNLEGLWSAVKRLGIAIGAMVEGEGRSFITMLTDMVDGITKFTAEHETLTATILVLAGLAAVIGPVLIIVGTLLTMLPSLVAGWTLVTGAVTAYTGVTIAATAASIALTVAQGGLLLAVAALAVYVGTQMSGAMDEYNATVEKAIELNAKMQAQLGKEHSGSLAELNAISDPGQKKDAIAQELERQQNEAAGMESRVKSLRKETAALEPTWLSLGQAGKKLWEVSNSELKEAEIRAKAVNDHVKDLTKAYESASAAEEKALNKPKAEVATAAAEMPEMLTGKEEKAAEKLEEKVRKLTESLQHQAEAAGESSKEMQIYNLELAGASKESLEAARAAAKLLDQQKQDLAVKNLTESLQHQVETFGMGSKEMEIFKLQQKGATEEELKAARAAAAKLKGLEENKKMEEKANKLMEKYISPREKFAKTEEELNMMRSKGKISLEAYNYEMDEARKLMNKEMKVKFSTSGIEGVLAGTAEAAMATYNFRQLQASAVAEAKPVEKAITEVKAPPDIAQLQLDHINGKVKAEQDAKDRAGLAAEQNAPGATPETDMVTLLERIATNTEPDEFGDDPTFTLSAANLN